MIVNDSYFEFASTRSVVRGVVRIVIAWIHQQKASFDCDS